MDSAPRPTKRNQRRIKTALSRFLRKREQFHHAQDRMYESRDHLIEVVGPGVRYLTKKEHESSIRVLLGEDEPEIDPEMLQKFLADDQETFAKCVERKVEVTVVVSFNSTLRTGRLLKALQTIATKFGGYLKETNPSKLRRDSINNAKVDQYVTGGVEGLPSWVFKSLGRYARVYKDPVTKIEDVEND
jgi:hypothetical protein